MDNSSQEKYAQLRQDVEHVLGFALQQYGDFARLETAIMQRQREHISSTTLRRFWGYQSDQNCELRESSLDILARFAGYLSWSNFLSSGSNKTESGRGDGRKISVSELRSGDELRLLWNPDREVIVHFEGQDLFTVVSSKGSKLQSGDTFHCQTIIDGMPLVLTCLVSKGLPPTNYVCGQLNGIRFFFQPKEAQQL